MFNLLRDPAFGFPLFPAQEFPDFRETESGLQSPITHGTDRRGGDRRRPDRGGAPVRGPPPIDLSVDQGMESRKIRRRAKIGACFRNSS